MKKILLTALSVTSFLAAESLYVGVVDLGKIVKAFPEYASIEKDLEKEAQQAQIKFQNKKSQLDDKIKEIEQSRATLSDVKIQKIRREITSLQRELKFLESDLNEDLSFREQEQKNALVQRAIALVAEFAKKQELKVVLPVEQAIYHSDKIDVTDQVIQSTKK
jgi:outer membrane protein